MHLDAFGRLLDVEVPETVQCTACNSHADRLSSAWQGDGIAYHNYQCRAEDCPAGGTIVEHDDGDERHVGPVFRAPRTHHPRRRADHPAGRSVPADHEHPETVTEVAP